MTKGARGKSTRGMAITAILVTGRTRNVRNGWHVRIERRGKWLACGSNLRWCRICVWGVIAMARLAVSNDTGMIKVEGWFKYLGVMA